MIESELGAPIETLFTSFEERPVAAASLAQVEHIYIYIYIGGSG